MMLKKILRYKKGIVLAVFLALIAAGGATYYYKNSPPVETDTTAVVGRGDIKATVSATGTIKAVNSVAVGSRVTGLITEVRVNENDIVKKGQVLVVLDDTALKAQLEQYQAQVTNYEAAYERSKKLYAIGGEAAQQLDSDRMNYRVAKASYDNLAAQLSYYMMTAPVDGMVIGTPSAVGTTVVQGLDTAQTIVTIADMSKMQIKVLVDESDIGKVKVAQQVTFTVDAYTDKIFTGTVTKISRDATTSSNVVYYPVYVAVDSPEDLLYPTMTARVTINVGERKNAVVVPLAAIREDKGQKYVQVMVNGKPQNTPVKTGLSDEDNVEILSGINEGDQIVLPAAKARTTSTSQNQGPPPPI
ncbi:MAG: efflux RND transporter periplasmic adaptor subunit [Negativicutes bacterium]|nr:efflux RND transporter periplasmic adaptor subunit [Negativicutes bacterium]